MLFISVHSPKSPGGVELNGKTATSSGENDKWAHRDPRAPTNPPGSPRPGESPVQPSHDPNP